MAIKGNEGAVGLAVYLGSESSCSLFIVHNAGTAKRLEVNVLRRCAKKRGRLPANKVTTPQELIAKMLSVRRHKAAK